jgi:hypothetical protein
LAKWKAKWKMRQATTRSMARQASGRLALLEAAAALEGAVIDLDLPAGDIPLQPLTGLRQGVHHIGERHPFDGVIVASDTPTLGRRVACPQLDIHQAKGGFRQG